MVALTASTPADAWIVGTCRSTQEDVTTHYNSKIYKRCWPDCLIAIEPGDNSMRTAIIDYQHDGHTGAVNVAVMSNDSRLLQGNKGIIGAAQKLGDLPNSDGLTNWKVVFGGLEPGHHYIMVIYGSDPEDPFFRSCFVTDDNPDSKWFWEK